MVLSIRALLFCYGTIQIVFGYLLLLQCYDDYGGNTLLCGGTAFPSIPNLAAR